jgi:hypothetical protein
VLSVKARERKDLKIALTENATVATVKVLKLPDIKPGMGTSALKRAVGALVTLELHVSRRTNQRDGLPAAPDY